jgi:hypothetical protein
VVALLFGFDDCVEEVEVVIPVDTKKIPTPTAEGAYEY